MKFDKTVVLLDIKGKPIKHAEQDLTLGTAIEEALLSNVRDPNDPPQLLESLGSKRKRWEICDRMQQTERVVEVSAEECHLVQRLIAAYWSPAVVGRACKILENPPAEVAPA